MGNTPEGRQKVRQTMIAKYGSEELYLEFMRSIAAKGGKLREKEDRPFYKDRELARRAGAIGRKNRNEISENI